MNFGGLPQQGRNLLKAILIFLGVAGVVTIAYNPLSEMKGVSFN